MGLSVRGAAEQEEFRRAFAAGEPYRLQELRLHLTRRCNLRCVMCRLGRDKTEPNTREILEIIDQAIPMGLRTVKLFGGEPLLRDDLETLVAEISLRGLRSTLTTNGTMIDEKKAEGLIAASLGTLSVSLDAPFASVHDRIRGVEGAWTRTVRGLDAVARARAGGAGRLAVVHVNTVVLRENIRTLPALIPFLHEHGVGSLALIPVSLPAEGSFGRDEAERLLPDADDIRWYDDNCAELLLRDARRLGVELLPGNERFFGRTPAEKASAARGFFVESLLGRASCLRAWYHLTVDASLDVFLCKRVRGSSLQPAGSLKKEPLREIWLNPKCRAFREKSRRPSFPECRACCLPVMLNNYESTKKILG